MAAEFGQPDCVRLLMECGVNKEATDKVRVGREKMKWHAEIMKTEVSA